MRIWGIHKRYEGLSWWENFTGGHLNIGPMTIWGANAMNWAVSIYTKRWGYICFSLPAIARFKRSRYTGKLYFDWYFYISPNGTPWASTYYIGVNKKEHIRAQIRKLRFGHNFKPNIRNEDLRELNDKMSFI